MSFSAKSGLPVTSALKSCFGDDHEAAGFECLDGGRARAFVNDQLAEIFARAEHVDHHFAPVGIAQKNFYAAGQDDEYGVRPVAFVHDHGVFMIGLLGRVRGKRAQFVVIECVSGGFKAGRFGGRRAHAAFTFWPILSKPNTSSAEWPLMLRGPSAVRPAPSPTISATIREQTR